MGVTLRHYSFHDEFTKDGKIMRNRARSKRQLAFFEYQAAKLPDLATKYVETEIALKIVEPSPIIKIRNNSLCYQTPVERLLQIFKTPTQQKLIEKIKSDAFDEYQVQFNIAYPKPILTTHLDLQKALTALDENKIDEAIDYFQTATRQTIPAIEKCIAYFKLAEIYYAEKDYVQCLEMFYQAYIANTACYRAATSQKAPKKRRKFASHYFNQGLLILQHMSAVIEIFCSQIRITYEKNIRNEPIDPVTDLLHTDFLTEPHYHKLHAETVNYAESLIANTAAINADKLIHFIIANILQSAFSCAEIRQYLDCLLSEMNQANIAKLNLKQATVVDNPNTLFKRKKLGSELDSRAILPNKLRRGQNN